MNFLIINNKRNKFENLYIITLFACLPTHIYTNFLFKVFKFPQLDLPIRIVSTGIDMDET